MSGRVCEHCGSALPEFGGIILDRDRAEIRYGGKRCGSLTPQEMAVFEFIFERAGRIVPKEAILEHLYQLRRTEEEVPEIKIVDVYVCKLRKKIKPLGIDIGTSWGRGYYMADPNAEAI